LCVPEFAVPQVFGDIGRGLRGGLPYQAWAAELVKARRAENGKDDPTTHCLPGGVAKLHTSALLRKIIQVPGVIVFLKERNASYRQIFTDGQWLDRSGSPLTSAAHMTEKFRRVNYGTLNVEMTVDDPKAYTKPWTIQLTQGLVLDTELLDYICLENEKDAAHLVGGK
jgi:hypothetical protein